MNKLRRIAFIAFLALYAVPLTAFAVFGFFAMVRSAHPLVAAVYPFLFGYALWAFWKGTLMLRHYNPALPRTFSPHIATSRLISGLVLGIGLAGLAGVFALLGDFILEAVFWVSLPAVIMASYLLKKYIAGERQREQNATPI